MRFITHHALFLLLTTGAVALATPQTAMAQSDDEATTRKVLQLVREAKVKQEANMWAEALSLYEQAYALKPLPALLYPMAKAAEGAGQKRKAITYYEKFVAALPGEEAAVRVVNKELPELKATIPPTLKIVSTPAGANIYRDSIEKPPIGSTPYEGTFEKGNINIIVRLDGYEPITRQLTLRGADEQELKLDLVPRKDDARAPTRREVSQVEDPGSSSSPLKPVGIATAGVGVALLATGATFSVLSMNRVNEVNDYDKAGASSGAQGRRELEDLKDDAERFYNVSLVSYIVGGVAAGVGVGMWAYGSSQAAPEQDPQALRWNLSVGRERAVLGLERAW